MSPFDWIRAVRDCRAKLSASDRAVLYTLATYANGEGLCFPSRELIAEGSGLSVRRVSSAIRRLVNAGAMTVTHTIGRPTKYHLTPDAASPPDAASTPDGASRGRDDSSTPDETSPPDGAARPPDETSRVPLTERPVPLTERPPKSPIKGPTEESKEESKTRDERAALIADWDRLAKQWKALHPGGKSLVRSKGLGKDLWVRLQAEGTESVAKVLNWAHKSNHQRAEFLRSQGLSLTTLMRPSKFEQYLAFAEAPQPLDRGQCREDDHDDVQATDADEQALLRLAGGV